jgi:hypothetical protein
MNKRQAKFIMELPDGYEWEFINNGRFIAGYKDQSILVYEIIGDELKQCEINHDTENIREQN